MKGREDVSENTKILKKIVFSYNCLHFLPISQTLRFLISLFFQDLGVIDFTFSRTA